MVEVGQPYTTSGGSQIVITKVGKRFIKAKVLAEGAISLGVIRYLKEPITGHYCAFEEGVEYDFHEGLLSPESDEWGPWVETFDWDSVIKASKGCTKELRFDANDIGLAYRVKKG